MRSEYVYVVSRSPARQPPFLAHLKRLGAQKLARGPNEFVASPGEVLGQYRNFNGVNGRRAGGREDGTVMFVALLDGNVRK